MRWNILVFFIIFIVFFLISINDLFAKNEKVLKNILKTMEFEDDTNIYTI